MTYDYVIAGAGGLLGWPTVAGRAVELIDVRDDRAREQAPRSKVSACAAQEGDAFGRASKQLDRLHGGYAQREVMAVDVERPCVRADRLHRCPRGEHDLDRHGREA